MLSLQAPCLGSICGTTSVRMVGTPSEIRLFYAAKYFQHQVAKLSELLSQLLQPRVSTEEVITQNQPLCSYRRGANRCDFEEFSDGSNLWKCSARRLQPLSRQLRDSLPGSLRICLSNICQKIVADADTCSSILSDGFDI